MSTSLPTTSDSDPGTAQKTADGAPLESFHSLQEYMQHAQTRHEERVEKMLIRHEESVIKAIERSFIHYLSMQSQDPNSLPRVAPAPAMKVPAQVNDIEDGKVNGLAQHDKATDSKSSPSGFLGNNDAKAEQEGNGSPIPKLGPKVIIQEGNGLPIPKVSLHQKLELNTPADIGEKAGHDSSLSKEVDQQDASTSKMTTIATPKKLMTQSTMDTTATSPSWPITSNSRKSALSQKSNKDVQSEMLSSLASDDDFDYGVSTASSRITTSRLSVLGRSVQATKRVSSSKLNFWNERQDDKEQQGRKSVSKLIHSNAFEFIIIFLIVINGGLIGQQIDYVATYGREKDLPLWMTVMEKLFCVLFTIELILRVLGLGVKGFVCNKNWKFHVLDTVIVVSAWVEQVVLAAENTDQEGDSQNLFVFGALRILRLVRVARSVRLMEFSRDLRNLINGLIHCLHSLFWAIFLLMLITFMFCVILMEFAIDEFSYAGDDDYANVTAMAGGVAGYESSYGPPVGTSDAKIKGDTQSHFGYAIELQWYFGNLPRGMFSLFQAISGGRNWGEISEPFKHISWALVIFFAVYVGTVIFAVLNIVTSIFIENARKNNLRDKNNLIWEEIQERNWRVESLRAIFSNADLDGNGVMSFEEFEDFFEDPILQAFFRTLGLDFETYDPKNIFKLFDVKGEGLIDIDGFVASCIHMRGSSKSIDQQICQLTLQDLDRKVHRNNNLFKLLLESMRETQEMVRRVGSGEHIPPEGQPSVLGWSQPSVPSRSPFPKPKPTNPTVPASPNLDLMTSI